LKAALRELDYGALISLDVRRENHVVGFVSLREIRSDTLAI
jgi:hypothetical protein